VARLPENIPAHQAMLRQVELSVSRPPHPSWKRLPGWPRTKWTDQLCRDNSNVPIATLWRQAIGPSRLRVNDDDDDDVSKEVYETSHSRRTRGWVINGTDCIVSAVYIVSIWGTHGFLWGLVVGDGSELTNQSDDDRVHGSTEDEMEQNYFVASVPTV